MRSAQVASVSRPQGRSPSERDDMQSCFAFLEGMVSRVASDQLTSMAAARTCRCRWRLSPHRLDHVPMFHHLAILEFENVDDGVHARARLAHGVDMDDDVIAVGEDALNLAAIVRKFLLQKADEALEAFPAVGRQ